MPAVSDLGFFPCKQQKRLKFKTQFFYFVASYTLKSIKCYKLDVSLSLQPLGVDVEFALVSFNMEHPPNTGLPNIILQTTFKIRKADMCLKE